MHTVAIFIFCRHHCKATRQYWKKPHFRGCFKELSSFDILHHERNKKQCQTEITAWDKSIKSFTLLFSCSSFFNRVTSHVDPFLFLRNTKCMTDTLQLKTHNFKIGVSSLKHGSIVRNCYIIRLLQRRINCLLFTVSKPFCSQRMILFFVGKQSCFV